MPFVIFLKNILLRNEAECNYRLIQDRIDLQLGFLDEIQDFDSLYAIVLLTPFSPFLR